MYTKREKRNWLVQTLYSQICHTPENRDCIHACWLVHGHAYQPSAL